MDNLQERTNQELVKELEGLKKQLLDLTLKKCSGQLTRPHLISETRKQIARIYTFLGQKACKL